MSVLLRGAHVGRADLFHLHLYSSDGETMKEVAACGEVISAAPGLLQAHQIHHGATRRTRRASASPVRLFSLDRLASFIAAGVQPEVSRHHGPLVHPQVEGSVA